MQTIKRVIDAAIVGMVSLGLALTGMFLLRRHSEPAAPANVRTAASEKLNATDAPAPTDSPPGTASTNHSRDVSAAMLLLLRAGTITSEVFSCPSTQPSERDDRQGAITDQNWVNWNGKATPTPIGASYSYENPYPATQGAVASTASTSLSPSEVESLFRLARENDGGGARPFTCPSLSASKWDYGERMNTAQNWTNWASTSGSGIFLINESYSYKNPYRAATASSKP